MLLHCLLGYFEQELICLGAIKYIAQLLAIYICITCIDIRLKGDARTKLIPTVRVPMPVTKKKSGSSARPLPPPPPPPREATPTSVSNHNLFRFI